MAYNPETSLISAPVSIFDVQRSLGLAYGDLGRLITNGSINKWARYKPVVYPDVSGSNDGKGTVIATTSQLQMFGLTAPMVTSYADGAVLAAYRAGGNWQYTKPTGGASAPFRLTDFNGYNHRALPFAYVDQGQAGEAQFNVFASALTFLLGYPSDVFSYPNCISLSDFGSGYYTAVELYQRPGDDPGDMSRWSYLTAYGGSTSNQYSVTVPNTNGRFQDQFYYALVPYIGRTSPQQRFLLPWDSDHYFAYRFQAVGLPFFEVESAYLALSGSPNYTIELRPSSTAQNYHVGSVSTTVYLQLRITTYRGLNGAVRNLTFGPSQTDRLRVQINGQGGMYDASLVDANGNDITSQTVQVNDSVTHATLYLKLTGVDTSLWALGQSGLYMPNAVRVYVSHNSGSVWQAGTNCSYEGSCYLNIN